MVSRTSRIPPEHADLKFARNTGTGRVHILSYVPTPYDPEWEEPKILDFAAGLAAMFSTPHQMLCGARLLVSGLEGFAAVWAAGDDFADDDLCIRCVQTLGDQAWRAFHADNRGPSGAASRLEGP